MFCLAGVRSCEWRETRQCLLMSELQIQEFNQVARLLVCSLPTPTSSPTSKAMPQSKNSESTGIKKEKQTTNPIKAPPAQKAKDAAKKAVKTSKKHGNKENNASSGTTSQRRAKPSQQKSEGVNRQREASPDVDALKVRIKELEGTSNSLFSIMGILIFCNTDSPCLQRLLECKRVLRLRRS
jgi:hypothetical protein